MMIFVLVTCLFIVSLIGYFFKYLKLGKPVDALIANLDKEFTTPFIKGTTGYAINGNFKICYELIKSNQPNGEYLVLLHGLTRTMLSYPTYFIDDFLAAGYHIVRIDNRDSGMSTWVKDWENGQQYSLEDMVEDTIAVLNHLQVDQFHIMGKSMGGMIAQSLAIQYPKRVRSLISMMSTAYFYDPYLTQVPRQFTFQFALIYIAYRLGSKQLKHQLKFNLGVERILAGENKNTIDEKYILQKTLFEIKHRKGFNKRAQKQQGYAIKKSGSRIEALKKLTTPTLIIHGTADPLVKFEHGQKCAEIILQAQHLFVDGMGHRVPRIYSGSITKVVIQFLGGSQSIITPNE